MRQPIPDTIRLGEDPELGPFFVVRGHFAGSIDEREVFGPTGFRELVFLPRPQTPPTGVNS
jgi:hypothetical protein